MITVMGLLSCSEWNDDLYREPVPEPDEDPGIVTADGQLYNMNLDMWTKDGSNENCFGPGATYWQKRVWASPNATTSMMGYNTVAPAGTSEHQTGLAFDVTVPGVSFTGTEQQKWLHQHCHEYGFVVRFTKEKQELTGFIAESWHIRYVGLEAAQNMTKNNWCLEEYVQNVLR